MDDWMEEREEMNLGVENEGLEKEKRRAGVSSVRRDTTFITFWSSVDEESLSVMEEDWMVRASWRKGVRWERM